jgi:hypothetical protein
LARSHTPFVQIRPPKAQPLVFSFAPKNTSLPR